MEGLQRLYKELFSQYSELAEGDIMLSEKLDLYGDKYREEGEEKAKLEIAKSLLNRGMNTKEIAEVTGLSLKTIKALQSKQKVA
jgi:predicted transposase/invertase (TIGR01784 family)